MVLDAEIAVAFRVAAEIEAAISGLDDRLSVAALSDVFSSILAGYPESEQHRIVDDFAAGVALILPTKIELVIGRP